MSKKPDKDQHLRSLENYLEKSTEYLELAKIEVAGLRAELASGGAGASSSHSGKKEQMKRKINRVLERRQKNRLKP